MTSAIDCMRRRFSRCSSSLRRPTKMPTQLSLSNRSGILSLIAVPSNDMRLPAAWLLIAR